MIKANIVIEIEDGNNVYNVGDKVRILMKPLAEHKSGYEYIGKIVDIQENFMTISNSDFDFKVLHYVRIDRMRFAKDNETFGNTWNFDQQVVVGLIFNNIVGKIQLRNR